MANQGLANGTNNLGRKNPLIGQCHELNICFESTKNKSGIFLRNADDFHNF